MDAIERIEVALRASIVNKLAVQHTAHFYTRSRHYHDSKAFKEFIEKTIKEKSAALDHYYKNYNDPPFPPIWAVLEVISIGTLSQLYSKLHVKNRKLISKSFGYDEEVLVSWFRSIANLRNKSAHHGTVWNITEAEKPCIAKSLRTVFGTSQNNFYARAVVLNALTQQVQAESGWHDELKNLFSDFPSIASAKLGFPAGWETMDFWN